MLTNYTIEPCFRFSRTPHTTPRKPRNSKHLRSHNHPQHRPCVIQPAPKKISTPTRFELARAEPIGFQNQLLNHSDTVSPAYGQGAAIPHRQTKKQRHRRDLNSRGQSPVDFESTSLTTRTRCLGRSTGPPPRTRTRTSLSPMQLAGRGDGTKRERRGSPGASTARESPHWDRDQRTKNKKTKKMFPSESKFRSWDL